MISDSASRDASSPPNDSEPPIAAGVDYYSIDGVPGRFFRCLPYRATLSISACAYRWRKAQRVRGDAAIPFEKCRTCPIGAAHAGEAVTYYSPLFGKPICCRCGKVSMRRMIGGRLCLSCYNREVEIRRGRNSKGNAPKKLAPLDRRTVRYAIDGAGVETFSLERSADLTELMVAVLRKVRGRVAFAFHGGPVPGAVAA